MQSNENKKKRKLKKLRTDFVKKTPEGELKKNLIMR